MLQLNSLICESSTKPIDITNSHRQCYLPTPSLSESLQWFVCHDWCRWILDSILSWYQYRECSMLTILSRQLQQMHLSRTRSYLDPIQVDQTQQNQGFFFDGSRLFVAHISTTVFEKIRQWIQKQRGIRLMRWFKYI